MLTLHTYQVFKCGWSNKFLQTFYIGSSKRGVSWFFKGRCLWIMIICYEWLTEWVIVVDSASENEHCKEQTQQRNLKDKVSKRFFFRLRSAWPKQSVATLQLIQSCRVDHWLNQFSGQTRKQHGCCCCWVYNYTYLRSFPKTRDISLAPHVYLRSEWSPEQKYLPRWPPQHPWRHVWSTSLRVVATR